MPQDIKQRIVAEDKTKSAFRSVERSIDGMRSKFIALAGVVGTIGFGAATTAALNYADSIADAADRTAFSISSLQELKFAAEQNGVQFAELEAGLARFTKRLGLARIGTGAAADAYKKLGIDLTQTNNQVFRQVVETLGQVESETNRLALTTRLFGDDAQRLGVVFRDGVSGIDAYARRARELGLVLSDDLVKGASDANDQLDIMKAVVGTQVTRALVSLAPIITQVGQAFADAAVQVAAFFASFDDAGEQNLNALAISLDRTFNDIQRLQRELKIANELGKSENFSFKLTGPEQFGVSLGRYDNADKIRRELEAAQTLYQDLENQLDSIIAKERTASANPPKPPPIGDLGALANYTTEYKKFQAEFEKLEGQLDPVSAATKSYMENVALLDKAWTDGLISGERYDQLMMALAEDTNAAVAATDSMDAAMDLIIAQFEELDAAEARTFAGLDKQVAKSKDGFSELGQIVTSAFEDAIVSGGDLSDVLKGLEQDIIRLVARMVVTRPLTTALEGIGGDLSSSIGDFFAGLFKASGGPVRKDMPYIVGEEGPELFVPGASGSIVPNNRLTSGGGSPIGGSNVVVNLIESPGNGGKTSQRQDGNQFVMDIFVEQIRDSMIRDVRTGGPFSRALSDQYGVNRAAGAY